MRQILRLAYLLYEFRLSFMADPSLLMISVRLHLVGALNNQTDRLCGALFHRPQKIVMLPDARVSVLRSVVVTRFRPRPENQHSPALFVGKNLRRGSQPH